jgi:hypothetical protein
MATETLDAEIPEGLTGSIWSEALPVMVVSGAAMKNPVGGDVIEEVGFWTS